MLAHGGKVGGAQVLTADLRAQRLDNFECCLDARTGLSQTAARAFPAGDVVERRGRAEEMLRALVERQRAVVIVECLLRLSLCFVNAAEQIERRGLIAPVFLGME